MMAARGQAEDAGYVTTIVQALQDILSTTLTEMDHALTLQNACHRMFGA